MIILLLIFFTTQTVAAPIVNYVRSHDLSGLEVLNLDLSIRLGETIVAGLSVGIVTTVYGLLIQRGSLMSTTALYPKRGIEQNIGNLLSISWPSRAVDILSPNPESKVDTSLTNVSKRGPIQLLYLGKMLDETDRTAKGLTESCATAQGTPNRSALWLTSGSPLTKAIVQSLIWEWASLWLLMQMLLTTLMFNGFFTGQLSLDSYPRLAVILIYAISYISHFAYVWRISGRFFSNVAAGATWSVLERARFAVAERKKLHNYKAGQPFEFRGIEKVSAEYVPFTFAARFKNEVDVEVKVDNISSSSSETLIDDGQDSKEVTAALATLDSTQKLERTSATLSATQAAERIVSNAMVMMGVTISTGFSAWTSRQMTVNTPNNFSSSQIGSLALLGSLALGAAAMFSSAMHLSTMEATYKTMVSLKEVKINGHAFEHYKKRRAAEAPISFTSGTVPSSIITFGDILKTNKAKDFFGVLLFGPAYALLPSRQDHDRTSSGIDFDLNVNVRGSDVLLTTRTTASHTRGKDGSNAEAINVCYVGECSSSPKDVLDSSSEKICKAV